MPASAREHVLDLLEGHQPTGPREGEAVERVRTFVEGADAPLDRSNEAGHVVASGLVASGTLDRVVLLHHRGLDRWLQCGGHADRARRGLVRLHGGKRWRRRGSSAWTSIPCGRGCWMWMCTRSLQRAGRPRTFTWTYGSFSWATPGRSRGHRKARPTRRAGSPWTRRVGRWRWMRACNGCFGKRIRCAWMQAMRPPGSMKRRVKRGRGGRGWRRRRFRLLR